VTISDEDWLTLDFPNRPPQEEGEHDLLRKALGGNPTSFHKSRDYLVTYNTEAEVRALKPVFTLLSQVESLGIIATAAGDEMDFVSRFFAPRAGINEDPVTGSAHCTLAPFWQKHLKKDELKAKQISARGGELICKIAGGRFLISGQAVTYLQGNIFYQLTA
jgi:predicted PhzF superfamily epimerase YddE/YHI9